MGTGGSDVSIDCDFRRAGALIRLQRVRTAGSDNADTPANSIVTVRGCVAPIERDGSLAAKAGATTTPDTISQEANNPNPTGVFMLLDATPATPSGPVAKRTSYARRSRVRARE